MSQSKKEKVEHSPTLNTIIMVEQCLKNIQPNAISVAELKRKLPKQVNHNTLMIILEYLEESNKISMTMKGLKWIRERK